MTNPKRHHFIPQMLLRRFVDEAGYLHFIDRRNLDGGVQLAKPENLLLERYLYSKIRKDGTRDASLELRYSKLEGAITPLIDEIIRLVSRGIAPILSDSAKRVWDLFLYEQWRRVPDMHNRVMPIASAQAMILEAVDAFESLHRPLTADERQQLFTPKAIAEFRQNAKVGALSRSSEQVLGALAGKGLVFGICKKRHSFILGSSPILKIAAGNSSRLDDPFVEVWLPIHPNIVVVAAGKKSETRIASSTKSGLRGGRAADPVRQLLLHSIAC